MPILNRRTLLVSTASLAFTASLPLRAETLPPIHVAKGTGCECCARHGWTTCEPKASL